jgi:hypothetical protein
MRAEARAGYLCPQIQLPPAVGGLLMDQDAPKNGAMFFELSSLGGRTHAGVLDFTAPAGTVVIPRKACNGSMLDLVYPLGSYTSDLRVDAHN